MYIISSCSSLSYQPCAPGITAIPVPERAGAGGLRSCSWWDAASPLCVLSTCHAAKTWLFSNSTFSGPQRCLPRKGVEYHPCLASTPRKNARWPELWSHSLPLLSGVRYNAEKKKVGNYYTTPIYRFRMKCHLCVNYIEMQTDPANCDYVIVSGAQRKEERWDMADNEQVLTTEHEKKQKLETDAMYRLEHGEADRSTLKKALPTLSHIQEAQNAWKDDFALNSMLRKRFREKKKAMLEEEERDQALQAKASLAIPLVPETEDDRKLAALLKFHTLDSYEDKQKLKRTEIISRSWFPSTSTSTSSTSKASSVLKKLAQNRRSVPAASSPITVGHLGIVRRRSREVPESPQHMAETLKSGEPRVPAGMAQDRPTSPQDCSQETTELPKNSGPPGQEGSCGDRPQTPPGTSQEAANPQDKAQPCGLSSSLVADYSGSESE
uniref:Probable splicing factor YJU2B n=1 Tax=Sus scrofa TaxID=9823 RepID=A0A8D1QDB3_PIG